MANRGWEDEAGKALLHTASRRTSTGCLGWPGLLQNRAGVLCTPKPPQQKLTPLRCFLASQNLGTEIGLML